MAHPDEEERRLRQRCQQLKPEIAQLGDLRRGSLVASHRKYGKPRCHCAREGDPRHGPSWILTREVRGKTVTSAIPAEALEPTRHQAAAYERLRGLTQALVETSERARGSALRVLKQGTAKAATERGRSKQPSRRPSSQSRR